MLPDPEPPDAEGFRSCDCLSPEVSKFPNGSSAYLYLGWRAITIQFCEHGPQRLVPALICPNDADGVVVDLDAVDDSLDLGLAGGDGALDGRKAATRLLTVPS